MTKLSWYNDEIMDKSLTQRQQTILNVLAGEAHGLKMTDIFRKSGLNVSQSTMLRDLSKLIDQSFVSKEGRTKSAKYKATMRYWVLTPIDVDEYFQTPQDERHVYTAYRSEIYDVLRELELFAPQQYAYFDDLARKYALVEQQLPDFLVKRTFEQLIIDLSWKSARIEGSTYTLLETEQLLKNAVKSEKRTMEETLMVLNHKHAIEELMKNSSTYKKLSVFNIRTIHKILTEGLGVSDDLRRITVGISGTNYKPLDNYAQIEDALLQMVDLVNSRKHWSDKILITLALLSYIQPFDDGNKRTARLTANSLLIARGLPPLSFRSVDDVQYKEATILFYEKNNLYALRELLIEQVEFTFAEYFGVKA